MRARSFHAAVGGALVRPAGNDNLRGAAPPGPAGAGPSGIGALQVSPLPLAAARLACAPVLGLGLGLSMVHLAQRIAMANACLGFAMLGALAAPRGAEPPPSPRLRVV
jgi:hypothetical protein